MDVIAEMERHKLMPVLRIDRKSDVRPLMRALCEGGLPAAEVTFRTECGAAALEAARREFPEMLIGAGTVICEEQARRSARRAGAPIFPAAGRRRRSCARAMRGFRR